MHLKILIAVVALGLSTVSAKAKGSPQGFINVPVSFFPGFGLVQNFGAQQFAAPYSVGFAFGNNNGYPANVIRGPIFVNPQANQAQNYQQQFPFPAPYPSAPSYAIQSTNNSGRLWPKNLVNPNGTPSPPISGPDPINYLIVSSTPSPLPQSTPFYGNSLVRNPQQSVSSTPAPSPTPYQQLIPVPVNVNNRNNFQQDVVRFPNGQVVPNTPIITSTVAPYLVNQQPNPFLPYQNLQIFASPAPFIANFQPSAAPFVVQYQPPSASGFAFQSQQVTPSPFPHLVNTYQQSTNSPLINRSNYNPQPTPSPYFKQTQQSTQFPFIAPNLSLRSNFLGNNNYQRPVTTPSPFQNIVRTQEPPTPSPFAVQQTTPSPFVRNFQPSAFSAQQEAAAFSNAGLFSQLQSNPSPIIPYQEPTTVSYIENDETTPTVLIGQHKIIKSPAQNQIESDSTKSTTPPTTKAHSKTHSVTIVSTTPIPQTTTEANELSLLRSTTPTPETLRPEIIKTEYTGLVSPQYNHITSTPSTTRSSYGTLVGQPSYVPLKTYNGYSSGSSQYNYDYLGKYSTLNNNQL